MARTSFDAKAISGLIDEFRKLAGNAFQKVIETFFNIMTPYSISGSIGRPTQEQNRSS